MLQLIKRCPEYAIGYKEYCQELYDNNVIYFRPTNPNSIDEDWFFRTKSWYDKKEKGLIEGQPISFHYWAVDDGKFIGEFQLRTEFPEKVMLDIGSIGYAVRVSEQGKGYGKEILRCGLEIAKEHGMDRVLLTINDKNTASIRVCEKLGGKLEDIIEAYNEAEGQHRLRRYWIAVGRRGATMNHLLRSTNDLMKNAHIPWAVCGGFALDLFLEKELRTHSDIDICVFERDREKILQYMSQNNWLVFEFRGGGKVRPLDGTLSSEVGRNLMCTNGECDMVKFYPCEEEGLLWYEFFHTGIKTFNYLEFLFNITSEDYFVFDEKHDIKREISKVVLFSNSIPYLAPEIVLLFKASRSENAEYQYDFEQTYEHMDEEQKMWFCRSMDVLYPNGHSWRV